MVTFIDNFNFAIFILFILLYAYQIFYVFVSLFSRDKKHEATALHKFAVIVAARNEKAVIGQLISSIKKQNYNPELIDIFVIADNCDDNTAEIARQNGAIVYERFDPEYIGKGYALDFAFKNIEADHNIESYDGYFVFDADNLLDKNYISEMNKIFSHGYRVVTSYRNSKNYDSNWISAGYSLWFLREARYINNSRMLLKTSCAVSGTGFLVHKDIIKSNNGWKHHLLTEDIEFSVDSIIKGEIIGYCGSAYIYDEQPCTFKQSWTQRLRWSKGFYQVFGAYGKRLVKTFFKEKSFSCYDMFMTVAPVMFVTLASIFINFIFLLYGIFGTNFVPELVPTTMGAIGASFANFYIVLYAFGLITTITEWDNINCTTSKKLFYTFTFPVFIFTYIPIAITALFKKVGWQPISHHIGKTIEDIQA